VISIPWHKPPSKRSRQILLPHGASRAAVRPERAERRARLVAAIARGRRWLDEIVSGVAINVEEIASRENCGTRQVNMTISLAFLAPDLVRAAVEGRCSRAVVARRRPARRAVGPAARRRGRTARLPGGVGRGLARAARGEREPAGRLRARHARLRTPRQRPVKLGGRFSRNAATPSRKSSVSAAAACSCASCSSCSSSVAVAAWSKSRFVMPMPRVGSSA